MGVSEPLCEAGSVSLAPASGSMGGASGQGGPAGSINLAPPASGGGHAPSASTSTSAAVPPAAAVAAAGLAQKAMQKAAASSAAQGAGRLLQRGASEVTLHVQANPYTITLMSFVGGIVLTVVSLLNVLNILNIFYPLHWMLQLYQLAAGLLIIVIDGPSEKLPPFLRERALKTAAFLLHSNTNRIIFYLFIACQQGSQASLFNWIVGWYFAFVAFGFAALQASSPRSNNTEESQPEPV